MTDVSGPMTQSGTTRLSDEHAGHDHQLVVAFACGDLPAEEQPDAQALIDRCRRCAALVDELHLIAAATRQELVAPARQRDFRLSEADAERLRGSGLTRFLRRLASPRLQVLQPLAGAAMAIGLLLMVTTAVLPGFGGMASSGAAPAAAPAAVDGGAARQFGGSDTGGAGSPPQEAASAAPAEAPVAPEVGVGGESGGAETGGITAADSLTDTSKMQNATELEASTAAGQEPTLPVGLGLALVGALLFVLLLVARRLTRDPLLR